MYADSPHYLPQPSWVTVRLWVFHCLEGASSGDSLDWKDLPPGEICSRVTSKVQPGSIILFHNAAKNTPEALPSIIECLIQEGYTFVPISQLILSGDYTIDHTGKQLPAQP